MALHYVLDGYNIVKQLPFLAKLKLEEGRDGLIQLLEQERPHGSATNQVTVVFDGLANVGGPQRYSLIQTVFSCDESADDKIKRLVADCENKKNIVVVTDDREIKFYVRALGARAVAVKQFLNQVRSHQDSTYLDNKKGRGEKKIPQTLENKINSELEGIWLSKRKPRQK